MVIFFSLPVVILDYYNVAGILLLTVNAACSAKPDKLRQFAGKESWPAGIPG